MRFIHNTPMHSVCKLQFVSATTLGTYSVITTVILSVNRLINLFYSIKCFAVQGSDDFTVNSTASIATHSAEQLALQLTRPNS